MARPRILAIYEPANGRSHLVLEGRIVTEREALEALGARLRRGYVHPDDAIAGRMLELARRSEVPAIVNSDRSAFVILSADEAPIREVAR